MKTPFIINGPHWVIMLIAVGLLGCNNPTLQKELPTALEIATAPDMAAAQKRDSPCLPGAIPTQWGRIWVDDNGDMIGIVFATAQGDYFERKDGTHACFFNLHRPVQSIDEAQVLNDRSNNGREIVPVEISVDKRWH